MNVALLVVAESLAEGADGAKDVLLLGSSYGSNAKAY